MSGVGPKHTNIRVFYVGWANEERLKLLRKVRWLNCDYSMAGEVGESGTLCSLCRVLQFMPRFPQSSTRKRGGMIQHGIRNQGRSAAYAWFYSYPISGSAADGASGNCT